jgi:uncharacterized protein YcbK (DUF882 family)
MSSPKLRYFKVEEFDSADLPGSGRVMDRSFLYTLDVTRDFAGIPFIINSGYRTPSHNEAVGGKPNSAHLKGLAADISAPDSKSKFLIVQAALKVGIDRIGIGKDFVHLDIDSELPNPCIWTY